MKIKTFLILATLSMSATTMFAQKGIQDGSRFGHGEDSINCLKNISIYTEYVKTNNFVDAYTPWKSVFNDAPIAQMATYTNGAKILRGLIAQAKDGATQKQYFEELMAVHDQRAKYLDQLNQYVKRPYKLSDVLSAKVQDYYSMGCPSNKTCYDMLKEVLEMDKVNADYYIMHEFMELSSRLIKEDESHKEQFIQDYILASGYANEAYKACTVEKAKANLKVAKDNIDAYFIKSGVATCENLQAIYAPKVAENKSNIDYLKQVITVMQLLGCTEEEAYFSASEFAHAIEPTPQTAVGCGYMFFKKGDITKCMEYFDQAISLEQDAEAKADYLYKAAVILFSQKSYGKAKQYAQKAFETNEQSAKPLVLIAKMYAASPNWNDEAALNKCTYFVVIDKLQRAKSIDPSVADECNELIGTYSRHTPKDEDLFFLGIKKGDKVTVGGWIGETTTVR